MNLREAKRILGGKLVFGNEEQVQAVRFMEKVNECCEKIESCDNDHLDAFLKDIEAVGCSCVVGFDSEVYEAAIQKLNGEENA